MVLRAPDQPGAYELRAFFNDDQTVIRASLPVSVTGSAVPPAGTDAPSAAATATVAAASQTPLPQIATIPGSSSVVLTMETAVVAPATTMRLTYSGMSGNTQDYIATAPAPATAGSGADSYVSYIYTNGERDGTAALLSPEKEGNYELRAIFAGGVGTVQAMLPFTVRADVRLTLEKPVFAPGETIRFDFSGLAGASQDYIATARAGSAATEYLGYGYVYANGARAGGLSLKAPDQPGDYELRAFLQHSPNAPKAVLPFTVSANP